MFSILSNMSPGKPCYFTIGAPQQVQIEGCKFLQSLQICQNFKRSYQIDGCKLGLPQKYRGALPSNGDLSYHSSFSCIFYTLQMAYLHMVVIWLILKLAFCKGLL